MSVRLVDFRSDRHKKCGKALLKESCYVISDLKHKIAGYAIIAWDDEGYSSFSAQEGGPISLPFLPSYIEQKFSSLVEITKK